MTAPAFAYVGPLGHLDGIDRALRRTIDPEMAMNIVDLGLVYGVDATTPTVRVSLTMTSAACPVAELIVSETAAELDRYFHGERPIDVTLTWDPPWTPERISAHARALLGW
jgi:metal-sulfur cluster biosynthetic enzyme